MNQALTGSIIIPTWNGKDYIEACLNSVLAQDYPNYEVIVVDNASSDGTPDRVAEHFPMVTLTRNEQNLGFAGGVNIGLRAAKGKVLILLNQDAVAQPGWLSAFISGVVAESDIGIAGCKILNADSQTIQHAGGCLTMPQAQPAHFGFGEIDTGQYDQSREVDYVTGAALAVRREVLETIGYLDETLFFYFEDVDYCYRARAAGFRVVYVPSAVVQHYGNTSLGVGTVSHYAKFHTSRLQFIIKHWDVSFFVSQFQPVERAWLKSVAHQERSGLRQAYQTVLEGIIRMEHGLRFDDDIRAKLLAALHDLRQQVSATYSTGAWRLLEEPPKPPKALSDRWWAVQERPFISSVPVVGSLIAWFRTVWNSVSTKWFVRGILQQQNEVNYALVNYLDMHSQILRNQIQLLHDLDRDQIDLGVQVVEILRRLDNIESRLDAIERRGTLK